MPGKPNPNGNQWDSQDPSLAVIGIDCSPNIPGQVIHLLLQTAGLGFIHLRLPGRFFQIVFDQIVHTDAEKL